MTERIPAGDAHPLRELVFEYLERVEEEGPAVLEDLCARHPEHAEALRARIDILAGTGLAGSVGIGAPTKLGGYRLMDRIGAGGMGVVYRARDEVLGRDVAIKLIHPGELLFPGAKERFWRETEAIARLAHPGIVPVHAAGEEKGVPYFAMEFVDGCTLAEAFATLLSGGRSVAQLRGDDLDAAIPGREASGGESGGTSAIFAGPWVAVSLRIVREVAEALEHAHRRGVLHRDLKPSNVMLTRGGRVMLVDFGLSSAEGAQRITRTGAAMGSLAYMSPEQLDGDWDAVGVQADVYGLGVMLYELCTGRLPYSARSVVRQRELVEAARFESPRRINGSVSRDLETVIGKALDPRAARRYSSAAELASELSAILDGRPIAAQRAGAVGRLVRWSRRRPAEAALLSLGVLVGVLGPLLFGWQQRKARIAIAERSSVIEEQSRELEERNDELRDKAAELRAAVDAVQEQRDLARRAGERAERNFEDSLAAVDTMLTRVGADSLRDVPGLLGLRNELLEEALRFYQRLAESNPDVEEEQRADVMLEIARASRRVGDLQGLLDRPREACAAFERAIVLYEELLGSQPASSSLREELSSVRQLYVLTLRDQGQTNRAEREIRTAIADLESAVQRDPSSVERRLLRQGLAVDLSRVLREQGRWREAVAELEAVLPWLEHAAEARPTDRLVHEQLAFAHGMLGVFWAEASSSQLEQRLIESERAEGHHRRSLRLLEPLTALYGGTELRRELARSYMNLGSVLLGLGRYAEGHDLVRISTGLCDELTRDFPGVTTFLEDKATAVLLLGAARAALGEYEAGLVQLLEGTELLRSLVEADDGGGTLRKWAAAELQLAIIAARVGQDYDSALSAVERSLEAHARALAVSRGMPQVRRGMMFAHDLHSSVLLQAAEPGAAGEAALAWGEVVQGPDERSTVALRVAECAAALEASAAEQASDEIQFLDEAAADMVARALDEGLDPEGLVRQPQFGPLLARPVVAQLLGLE